MQIEDLKQNYLSHVCCTGKMSSNRALCRRVELVSKGGVCQSAWPSMPMGRSSPFHIKHENCMYVDGEKKLAFGIAVS